MDGIFYIYWHFLKLKYKLRLFWLSNFCELKYIFFFTTIEVWIRAVFSGGILIAFSYQGGFNYVGNMYAYVTVLCWHVES